ncbi:50S ribosomal protein L3 [Maioricimonas sp. JC845]|uniref:50S ribosomal protein L3 n=1 Tax=Maioricimonas sp. JC845 TaxID=3232138 RepID=UPI0034584ED1
MAVGLLGRKVGMTQVYREDGTIVPVTVIEAGPCTVLQVKTVERDGYAAVQVGFDDKLSDRDLERPADQRVRNRASRAERGHVVQLSSNRQKARQAAGIDTVPKAGCEPKRFIREFRTDGESVEVEVGQVLDASVFDGVAKVDVVGTSKGRGTAGVMKRHNFAGQRASHGVKKVHRRPGSIGMSADPSRVLKGTRMAGQYGNARSTVRALEVVRIDPENNMIVVKGAIPGPNGGYVLVRPTNKCG